MIVYACKITEGGCMLLDSGLFTSGVSCPVCDESFVVVKVKSSAIRLERLDEDFCAHYSTLNPLLYEPFVCPHCGYAGYGSSFPNLSEVDKKKLQQVCLSKFTEDPDKNPFELTDFHKQVYQYMKLLKNEGERDYNAAIAAYKILVSNLTITNAPFSVMAKTLLKIGWIHRLMEDPKEMEYLAEAERFFSKSYIAEDLGVGTVTIAFLLGELNRRLGNLKEALGWFSKVITSPKSEQTAKLIEKARDLNMEIKSSKEFANLK
jgi:uncharacterized protein